MLKYEELQKFETQPIQYLKKEWKKYCDWNVKHDTECIFFPPTGLFQRMGILSSHCNTEDKIVGKPQMELVTTLRDRED